MIYVRMYVYTFKDMMNIIKIINIFTYSYISFCIFNTYHLDPYLRPKVLPPISKDDFYYDHMQKVKHLDDFVSILDLSID